MERAWESIKCKGPGTGTCLASLIYKKPWLEMVGIEGEVEDAASEIGKNKSQRASKGTVVSMCFILM